ncbi:hypothetical protein SH449x_003314 [Pirellulaceae bacterium SH449]
MMIFKMSTRLVSGLMGLLFPLGFVALSNDGCLWLCDSNIEAGLIELEPGIGQPAEFECLHRNGVKVSNFIYTTAGQTGIMGPPNLVQVNSFPETSCSSPCNASYPRIASFTGDYYAQIGTRSISDYYCFDPE